MVDVTNGRGKTPLVRYYGLVGAIDQYLEGIASGSAADVTSDVTSGLCEDVEACCGESQWDMVMVYGIW